MKLKRFWTVFIVVLFAGQVLAYDSRDAMIDDKLSILENASNPVKIRMLERLQWSGLDDARLFDAIAAIPPERYQSDAMDKPEIGVLSHRVRALGYSGSDRYRTILEDIRDSGGHRKLRGHAKKALADMERFRRQNELVAQSELDVSAKPFEIGVYMKMLSADDMAVQRNGARAVYHEDVEDVEVMALIAERLQATYMQEGLTGGQQDAVAWFVKVLGEKSYTDYTELLVDAADNSPSKKVRKYALKYTR